MKALSLVGDPIVIPVGQEIARSKKISKHPPLATKLWNAVVQAIPDEVS
jgi:hypothetical protein